MKTGLELIMDERERQISQEGFTAKHDAKHCADELAWAACYYAMPCSALVMANPEIRITPYNFFECTGWPKMWAKRGDDPIRNLTKAGALIAAEIDRLQAQKVSAPKEEDIVLPGNGDLDSLVEDYHFKLMTLIVELDRDPVAGTMHSRGGILYIVKGFPWVTRLLKTLEKEGLMQSMRNDDEIYELTDRGKKIKAQIKCVRVPEE